MALRQIGRFSDQLIPERSRTADGPKANSVSAAYAGRGQRKKKKGGSRGERGNVTKLEPEGSHAEGAVLNFE